MTCNRITRNHASHDCATCGMCEWHCNCHHCDCPKGQCRPQQHEGKTCAVSLHPIPVGYFSESRGEKSC